MKKLKKSQTEPSIVMDSAATSTVIRRADANYVSVLQDLSNKVFFNANGSKSNAGNKAKLKYNIREPTNDPDMVSSLAMNSLLSTSKLADADYITVFTKDEVQNFDSETTNLKIEGDAIMKGWRCPETKL